jgi:Holliday junction resolvase
MPHPSRRKGNRFERELVDAFTAAGLRAERAWGSDGRALRTDAGEPCTSDVDLLVEGSIRVQGKRRKRVVGYLKPPAGAHVAAIREDRGETLAVLPLALFIRLLRSALGGSL